jgi:hypothetical protein
MPEMLVGPGEEAAFQLQCGLGPPRRRGRREFKRLYLMRHAELQYMWLRKTLLRRV